MELGSKHIFLLYICFVFSIQTFNSLESEHWCVVEHSLTDPRSCDDHFDSSTEVLFGRIGDSCIYNRTIEIEVNVTLGISDAYTYICCEGYQGVTCSEEVCPEPCNNDGKCLNGKCHCWYDYHGPTCDQRILPPIVNVATIAHEDHEGICSTAGARQITTFDGKHFSFDGSCTYLLAYMEDDFSIKVNNNFDCSSTYGCKKAVYIDSYEDYSIVLYPNFTATLNGVFVEIPSMLNNLLLFKRPSSHYTTVRLPSRVEVIFDNEQEVIVLLPEAYMGEDVDGLCGNYDGDSENDFRLNGKVLDQSAFVYGMCDRLSSAGGCCLKEKRTPRACSNIPQATYQCDKLRSAPFTSCHHLISPQAYIELCLDEMCSCESEENYVDCSCTSFSKYSQHCAEVGAHIDWRRPDFCYENCSGLMSYQECGPSCTATCQSSQLIPDCESKFCMKGCFCPEGLIYDSDAESCILKEDCPCFSAGNTYHQNDVIYQGCNHCKCTGGMWKCTTNECAETCSMVAEDHYLTFDGKWIQFSGGCEYVLARTDFGVENSFFIWLDNTQCFFDDADEDSVCKKSLIIKFGDGSTYTINFDGKVLHANKIISLPYNSNYDETDEGDIEIKRVSSMFYRLKTEFGLEIEWSDDFDVYIELPPTFKNQVRGLCGLFNYDQRDDMTMSDGHVTVNPAEFGNSWKTNYGCEADMPFTGVANDICHTSMYYHKQAESICQVLKLDPFKSCNSKIPPNHYIKMCTHEMCLCQQRGEMNAEKCKCSVLSSYARACAKSDVDLTGWRSSAQCEVECMPGTGWSSCGGTENSVTCDHVRGDKSLLENNGTYCIEGCVCPEGKVYLNQLFNRCVLPEECPCVYNEESYPSGHVRISLCKTYTCSSGAWHEKPVPGCSLKACEEGFVWRNCSSSKCQATCKNPHPECGSSDCEEGCGCPEGKLLENGECVFGHECPCSLNGQQFANGETVNKDCNICTCQSSKWNCTHNECPATCTTFADSHFETFDEQAYDFFGECAYVLSEDFCGETTGNFRVIIENVPCTTGGIICSRAVKIIYHDKIIRMIRGVPPSVQRNPFAIASTPEAIFTIQQSGLFYIFDLEIGVRVMWDEGTRVYVNLQPHFKGNVCGLCGNFDGNALNDYRARQGELESNVGDFTHSWRVFGSCAQPETDIIHPCTANPSRAHWARSSCKVLREETFVPCHAVVDPEPYYEYCLWDSCHCDRGGDCECFCTAVAAYARACNDQGVNIRWRTSERCGLQCENGTEYQECGSVCTSSCPAYSSGENCDSDCFEGCHCPPGTIMHDGECIRGEECPCIINGTIVESGETLEEECLVCTCTEGRPICENICTAASPTTPYQTVTTSIFVTQTTGAPEMTTSGVQTTTEMYTTGPTQQTTIPGVTTSEMYTTGPSQQTTISGVTTTSPNITTTVGLTASTPTHSTAGSSTAFTTYFPPHAPTYNTTTASTESTPSPLTSCEGCWMEGQFHEYGDLWAEDECTTCFCSNSTYGTSCYNERDNCQSTCEDDEELVFTAGQCCPSCVKKVEAEPPSCSPKTLSLTFNVSDCVTTNPVEISVCSGFCESNIQTINEPPYVTTECKCCQPTKSETMTVDLVCSNGDTTSIAIETAQHCGCNSCLNT